MNWPDWWIVPTMIVAIITIVILILNLGRKAKMFENHEEVIKKHTELLQECDKKNLIDDEACKKAQAACKKEQSKNNVDILKAIQELKTEIREDRKEDRNLIGDLTRSIGRVEGVISKFKFNLEGNNGGI